MAVEPTPDIQQDDREQAESLSVRPSRPPTEVPGYQTEQFLGKGAFGEVWQAVDRNTGRRVAIKYYTNQGGIDWSLLSREVEKLRFLFGDRHAVQLIEVGWDANPPYYVMEYLERGSLEQLLEDGPLPVDRALALFRLVTAGLVHAHGKGILHCDLKPGNVLLDQDLAPRLADFGQSRLAGEHAAALGTLFYMAPEQADLKAVPDVRWDVYALGALLYRMLTGQPPYRTAQASKEIHQAGALQHRLTAYRQLVLKAPSPSAHRQAPGVDWSLAALIDRCLARNPARRFPNAQAVLSALDARALRRARRPLLVLGGVGPILLLLVIAFFAWRVFHLTIDSSRTALVEHSLQSNRLAARHVANTVAEGISRRWKILERVAGDPRHRQLFTTALSLLPRGEGDRGEGTRTEAARKALQKRLDNLFDSYQDTAAASSWFLLDARGYLATLSPKAKRVEIKNWKVDLSQSLAHRDYFHGRGEDRKPDDPGVGRLEPIRGPHLSTVFENKLGKKPRLVVFSVPVRSDSGKRIGVLCMGAELGGFRDFQSGSARSNGGRPADEFAVLVETRKDWTGKPGLILQHPELELHRSRPGKLPPIHLSAEALEKLEPLGRQHTDDELFLRNYQDPFGTENEAYRGRWLVVARPVRLKYRSPQAGLDRNGEPVELPPGWVVLVQEYHEDVIAPVKELQGKLIRAGVFALGATLLLLLGLWGFVVLVLNDSSRNRLVAFLRRKGRLPAGGASPSGSTTSHTGSPLSTGGTSQPASVTGSTTVQQSLPKSD